MVGWLNCGPFYEWYHGFIQRVFVKRKCLGRSPNCSSCQTKDPSAIRHLWPGKLCHNHRPSSRLFSDYFLTENQGNYRSKSKVQIKSSTPVTIIFKRFTNSEQKLIILCPFWTLIIARTEILAIRPLRLILAFASLVHQAVPWTVTIYGISHRLISGILFTASLTSFQSSSSALQPLFAPGRRWMLS